MLLGFMITNPEGSSVVKAAGGCVVVLRAVEFLSRSLQESWAKQDTGVCGDFQCVADHNTFAKKSTQILRICF